MIQYMKYNFIQKIQVDNHFNIYMISSTNFGD